MADPATVVGTKSKVEALDGKVIIGSCPNGEDFVGLDEEISCGFDEFEAWGLIRLDGDFVFGAVLVVEFCGFGNEVYAVGSLGEEPECTGLGLEQSRVLFGDFQRDDPVCGSGGQIKAEFCCLNGLIGFEL